MVTVEIRQALVPPGAILSFFPVLIKVRDGKHCQTEESVQIIQLQG